MRLGPATKMMALHYALKSLALADSDDVDKLFAVQNFNQHSISGLYGSIAVSLDRDLADEFHRRDIVLTEGTAHWLGQARLFYEFHQANLRRVVAVSSWRPLFRDPTRASLQHRRRTH